MNNTIPPTTQSALPITLTLLDAGAPVGGYIFSPNPDELTYSQPTRTNVINTLGGAWIDSFGQSVTEVTMKGYTGWTRQLGLIDGTAKLLLLRNQLYERFHSRRASSASAGADPDRVQLWFVDPLNVVVATVFPTHFQLDRNVKYPLLYRYEMKLIVLERHI